jgi:hypothetical protein
MSEYVRKQALVQEISGKIDWLIGRSEDYRSCGHENKACEFSKVISEFASLRGRIQSGAFDADESEGTWKATAEVLGRENAQLDSEIQRLRAALERIRKITKESREAKYYVDNYLLIETVAEQALSTTTEPTGAERVREYYHKLEELRNRTKYRDAAIEYEQRMTDICNVLDFLGITIPGINAPKKEGRTE